MAKKSMPSAQIELEGVASLEPLVEQGEREDEGQEAVAAGRKTSAGIDALASGRDELVRLAVLAVADAPARGFAGQRHGPHDLAHTSSRQTR